MNATKILWGQVIVVTATALLFLWSATEWTARRLAFGPRIKTNIMAIDTMIRTTTK
jgi:type IV secretion system protein VirD4